jgi:hypothetical protein
LVIAQLVFLQQADLEISVLPLSPKCWKFIMITSDLQNNARVLQDAIKCVNTWNEVLIDSIQPCSPIASCSSLLLVPQVQDGTSLSKGPSLLE